MRQISKDEKIQLLERFLRAVVGRPEAEIIYFGGHSYPRIRVECDIDDVIKIMSNLEISGEIYTFFYPRARKEKFLSNKSEWEGTTEVMFSFEPQYWKQVEELERKVKELEGKNKK
jgi:hypothetical protein